MERRLVQKKQKPNQQWNTTQTLRIDRTSLEVQWLRLLTLITGSMGSILGWGRSHMPGKKKKKKEETDLYPLTWKGVLIFSQNGGCGSWIIKKAEHRRMDAFQLWCWKRLLRVPWTARRSNQSILKEINPEYSLEELMLKLKFQYFGYRMQRADSLEKTLMLGKIEGRRRRGWQRMRRVDGITDSKDMSLSELWEMIKDREAWHAAVHGGVAKNGTRLSNWTTRY